MKWEVLDYFLFLTWATKGDFQEEARIKRDNARNAPNLLIYYQNDPDVLKITKNAPTCLRDKSREMF